MIVVIFSSKVVVTVLKVELSVVKTNLGSMNLGGGVCLLLALTITPPGTLVMKGPLIVVEETLEAFIAADVEVDDDDKVVVVEVVTEVVEEVIGSDLDVTLEAAVLKVVFVDV